MRTVNKDQVTWCTNWPVAKNGMCSYHYMAHEAGRHTWDGVEVTVDA